MRKYVEDEPVWVINKGGVRSELNFLGEGSEGRMYWSLTKQYLNSVKIGELEYVTGKLIDALMALSEFHHKKYH